MPPSTASTFLLHVTRDGERWDQISWRFYGDPHQYERVIAANPDVAITPLLPGGVELLIPVLAQDVASKFPDELLPPWKRRAAPGAQ